MEKILKTTGARTELAPGVITGTPPQNGQEVEGNLRKSKKSPGTDEGGEGGTSGNWGGDASHGASRPKPIEDGK